MAVLKCKMCGGDLVLTANSAVAKCEYCDSVQTVPALDDERVTTMFDRANYHRSKNEFDKAAVIYDSIIQEFPEEAEAHWGTTLCRYGVEYVVDPKSGKRIPTCHRTQFKSILEDDDYLTTLKYADVTAKEVYKKEAEYIDGVQKQILSISAKEAPFDIFICYKESDENENRTVDSVIAQDIYYALTEKEYKVFFARITLEDKLGTAYEPYIFAALNSAKLMLVVGTKPEYFNAVWVKNEWSRYLSLIEQGKKVSIIPCYRDISPYDLPNEFSALQAQDMGKIGAMQDLVRGIEKILGSKKPQVQQQQVVQRVAAAGATATTESLLKRVFIFLEDRDWGSADEYAEKVLDIDPENSDAYLGKFMAVRQLSSRSMLQAQNEDLYANPLFAKAKRNASPEQAAVLEGYRNQSMYQRGCNIIAKELSKESSYNGIIASKQAYGEVKSIFESISGYKDSDKKADDFSASLKQKAIDCSFVLQQRAVQKLAENELSRAAELLRYGKEDCAEEIEGLYIEFADSIAAKAATPEECDRAVSYYKKHNSYTDTDEKIQACIDKKDSILISYGDQWFENAKNSAHYEEALNCYKAVSDQSKVASKISLAGSNRDSFKSKERLESEKADINQRIYELERSIPVSENNIKNTKRYNKAENSILCKVGLFGYLAIIACVVIMFVMTRDAGASDTVAEDSAVLGGIAGIAAVFIIICNFIRTWRGLGFFCALFGYPIALLICPFVYIKDWISTAREKKAGKIAIRHEKQQLAENKKELAELKARLKALR